MVHTTNAIMEYLHSGVLTLEQIKERIRPVLDKHGIKEAYLFGSYSRNEANKNSDIDIYCDKGDVDTLWKQSAFRDELEKALGKEVDLVIMDEEIDDKRANGEEEETHTEDRGGRLKGVHAPLIGDIDSGLKQGATNG